MAKRRLNKRFVIALGGSALALAVLGVGGLKLRSHFMVQRPEKFLAAGRAALARKDYVAARENLMHAAALSHPDADLNVMIGDALNGLSYKDQDNVAAARAAWDQALTIDPSNVAAMERLIYFWRDELELHPRPGERAQIAGQIQKASKKLLDVDRDNALAKANYAEATLESMIDGLQLDSTRAKTAEDTLLELEPLDPSDSDLPYYVARAYLWQGQEAGRSDDAPAKAKFFADADKVLADAIKNQPNNGALHYRYGQMLLLLAAGPMQAPVISDETKQMVSKAVNEADLARQLIAPDDPKYLEINLYDARLTLERPTYAPNGPLPAGVSPATAPSNSTPSNSTPSNSTPSNPTARSADGLRAATYEPSRAMIAEAIYRDVLAHHPNDPATRIALAELIGNLHGRRDEAIAILSQPLINDQPVPGLKGTLLPIFQSEANIRLLSFELDAAEATRDPQKRPQLLAQADALCARVYGKSPELPSVLGLKGRLELLQGNIVEATQTLRHALTLTDPQNMTQQRSRYELIYDLARASEAAQQTGDAKKLATDVINTYPHFVPAQMMLARLLISEHDFAGAKAPIDFLESILPSNPELTTAVLRMRIATLDPVHDADRIKGYYNRLPEKTRDEQIDKAAFARLVKYDDEAIRLESLVLREFPGDAEAAINLVNWYQSHDQKDKALDVLAGARAANSSDANLLALQMQLAGKSMQNQTASAGGDQPTTSPTPTDPFSNEIAQAQLARSRNDMAGVDTHLAAAEKLKPDDVRVWDAIFMRALDVSNWDRATIYLEKLAAANTDRAGGLLYRVRLALARNEMQKAIDLAQQLTREKSEFSQSWAILAQVQKAVGNYPDAIANYGQALDRQTQNTEAIRGLVDCYYAVGDHQQAKHYIDLGRRVAPGNEAFQEMELSYELNYGDPQKVIEPRLRAEQASPEQPQKWTNLAAAYIASAQARAKAQDSAGSSGYYDQAKSTLQQAIAKFPDDPQFVAYFSKVAIDTGDFPSAEKCVLDFANAPSRKGRPQTAVIVSDFYGLAKKPELAAKVLSDYLASPFQPPDHAGDVHVQLQLATILASLNRIDDALAVLATNAQDPAIIHEKVGLLINSGRSAEADKVLDAMASAGPLSPELLGLKGVAALNAGKLPQARDCFDQVIAAEPNNVYALNERAQVGMRETPPNFTGALADLRHARDISPRDMDTRLLIVDVDRIQNQPEDAIHEMESAVQIAPTNKRVRLTLIDLYVNSKPPQWPDAERVLRETHQIPSLADDPDLGHAEAVVAMDRGDLTKAQDLIHAAMEKSPGNRAMVRTYYDILLKARAYEQLLSHSEQLLASAQNAAQLCWVYQYRAEARLRGTDDRSGAAAELEQGISLAQTAHDSNALSQLAQSYLKLLGSDAAIKLASAHMQSDPHWLLIAADFCRQKDDAHGALGWLQMALDRFDSLTNGDQTQTLHLAASEYLAENPPDPSKSADMYRRIVKRSPNDVDSLNNLACILVEPGSGQAYSPREALDFSERAYNLMIHAGADEPLIKDTYGWTLIANGRNDEGLSLVQDALGKKDFPEGHYHLAEALLKRQPPSPEDAASELTKAIQLIDQSERDGKPVDDTLKSHVQDELKRARSGLNG